MRNLWSLEKISILPLIISATGIVPQSLFKNLLVPRRNSDSHLVFRDPTQLGAKKPIIGKFASWNLDFCNSCVVLLRNVQVPRRNSDSHLVFRDPTHLRAKKRI
jgi:hypothetical protein